MNNDCKFRGIDNIVCKKILIQSNEDTPGSPFTGMEDKFVKALRSKLSNGGRIKSRAFSFLNAEGSTVTFFNFSFDRVTFIISLLACSTALVLAIFFTID
jgi:hypothetical protein